MRSIYRVQSFLTLLQRMASTATFDRVFQNLRLGEAAKMPAASGGLAANGWAKIPVAINKNLVIQWGVISTSTTSLSYICDIKFPISFPSACVSVSIGSGVYTGDLDRNTRYRNLKQEVTLALPGTTGIQAQLIVTDGTTGDARFLQWVAFGY